MIFAIEGQRFESSLNFFYARSTTEAINYKHKLEARGERGKRTAGVGSKKREAGGNEMEKYT